VQDTKLRDYIEKPNDDLRIVREPIVSLVNGKFIVIHDRYTNITGISMTYYKTPNYFSPLTGINCELPIDLFDELVSGAVQLYVQYAAA